jgi:glycosyltransferase involved in cell wall biosynthesis
MGSGGLPDGHEAAGRSAAPTVTVVLPTRNRSGSIEAAIRSVLDGSFRDLELLVIDDASDDGTAAVVAGIVDDRLRYHREPVPGGAARARNIAISRAKGAYVAFQDSDDVWTEDHLDALVSVLEGEPRSIAVAYGYDRFADGTMVPGPEVASRTGDLGMDLLRYNFIGLPASMVRAEALRTVGSFDEGLPRLQDWDLFLRLSSTYRFAFVDRIVVYAGGGDERISTHQENYYVAVGRILEQHAERFEKAKSFAVSYRMQLARYELRRRRPLAALRHGMRACDHPRELLIWAGQRVVRRKSPVARHG